MLPVYIKREAGVVSVYKDKACTQRIATYPKGTGPRTRTTVMLNCYRWRCIYVD